jgi:hypothetical protein
MPALPSVCVSDVSCRARGVGRATGVGEGLRAYMCICVFGEPSGAICVTSGPRGAEALLSKVIARFLIPGRRTAHQAAANSLPRPHHA